MAEDSRHSGAEIVITAEMVSEGSKELCLFNPSEDEPSVMVSCVYRAMVLASPTVDCSRV